MGVGPSGRGLRPIPWSVRKRLLRQRFLRFMRTLDIRRLFRSQTRQRRRRNRKPRCPLAFFEARRTANFMCFWRGTSRKYLTLIPGNIHHAAVSVGDEHKVRQYLSNNTYNVDHREEEGR